MREKPVNNPLFGTRNQLANVNNPYQGHYKRVLFVCSAGLLRSATAAHVFSEAPYNWNTRTAGASREYALNPVNEALLAWAEVVFCMEQDHFDLLSYTFRERFEKYADKIRVLSIDDMYEYRDPNLILMLKSQVDAIIYPPSDYNDSGDDF